MVAEKVWFPVEEDIIKVELPVRSVPLLGTETVTLAAPVGTEALQDAVDAVDAVVLKTFGNIRWKRKPFMSLFIAYA